MGSVDCPEMSVRNYHSMMRKIRRDRRGQFSPLRKPEITQVLVYLVLRYTSGMTLVKITQFYSFFKCLMSLFCREDCVCTMLKVSVTAWPCAPCLASVFHCQWTCVMEWVRNYPRNTYWLLVLRSLIVITTGWLTAIPERSTPQHR